MKIGLCMSVINAGGGNDTVFYSLKHYLEKHNHQVSVFSNTVVNQQSLNMPKFGLFRQLLQTIEDYDKKIHEQDLLIFLTGIPPKTKVPIVYYHQQLPFSVFAKSGRPEKYNHGFWRLYYAVFALIAGIKSVSLERENIRHYCISYYLQEQLEKYGLDAGVIYPAIIQNDLPELAKIDRVITVCRISPEKNLEFNIKALKDFKYVIMGNTTKYTAYYCKELIKKLSPRHHIEHDIPRDEILRSFLTNKVYFSSSKETLGLSVLEAISGGCIPIVIDNTANKETVPFDVLRFKENIIDASIKVNKAINGDYDYLLPELRKHINRFTENNYDMLLKGEICAKTH